MKLYVAVIFLGICIIKSSSADWRDDLLNEHSNRLVSFIDGLNEILRVNAIEKGTKSALACYETAKIQFGELVFKHRADAEKCVSIANNQDQATLCLNKLRKEVIIKATSLNVVATDCINTSS